MTNLYTWIIKDLEKIKKIYITLANSFKDAIDNICIEIGIKLYKLTEEEIVYLKYSHLDNWFQHELEIFDKE